MSHDLTCRQFVDRILEYLEGDLTDQARELMREHMGLCRDCADYFDSYRATTELAKLVCDRQEAPALPEDLVARILETCDPRP